MLTPLARPLAALGALMMISASPLEAAAKEERPVNPKPAAETVKRPLPDEPWPRLAAVIEDQPSDAAWLAFYHVRAGRSVFGSYRYTIDAEGRLYFAARSEKNKDHNIPFDRPLPKAPTKTIDASEIQAIKAMIVEMKLLEHPGYETQDSRDGSCNAVKIKHEGRAHTVIFCNVMNPLVERLQRLAHGLR